MQVQIRGIPGSNEMTSDKRFPASSHEFIEVAQVLVTLFFFEWAAAGQLHKGWSITRVGTTIFWPPPPLPVFWRRRRRGEGRKRRIGDCPAAPIKHVQKLLPLFTQSHLLENGPKVTIISNRFHGYKNVVSVGPAHMTNNPQAIIDYRYKACSAEVRVSEREHAAVQ